MVLVIVRRCHLTYVVLSDIDTIIPPSRQCRYACPRSSNELSTHCQSGVAMPDPQAVLPPRASSLAVTCLPMPPSLTIIRPGIGYYVRANRHRRFTRAVGGGAA